MLKSNPNTITETQEIKIEITPTKISKFGNSYPLTMEERDSSRSLGTEFNNITFLP